MKQLTDTQIFAIKQEATLALGQLQINDEATHVMISIDAHQVKIVDHEQPELNTIIRQDRTHTALVDMQYGSIMRDPTINYYDLATAINQLVKALAMGEKRMTMGEIAREIEKGDSQ